MTHPWLIVPTVVRGLVSALWLAVHLPAGAQPDATEYLSVHTERLLQPTQLWGVLGINVAAHEPTKLGAPLRIGSQTYTNGFGHHATGKLEFLLNGEFDRFEVEVGLQPCPGGSVVFRVAADGAVIFDSGVMRSGDEPRPVRVSVADAEVLTLEALDAGDGISCDMANWANARLIPAARRPVAVVPNAVNIARFAQVVASDPNRLDGARANRLEEFRAEDVFLERELAPDAEGNYALTPNDRGLVSIGLKWSAPRALTSLRLTLPETLHGLDPRGISVQGWFGESAWQGRWLPLAGESSVAENQLVLRLAAIGPQGGLLQTRKVRWIIPADGPVQLREPQAFSRARWLELSVVAEFEQPPTGAHGRVRAFNGELLRIAGRAEVSRTEWNEWDLARPLRLAVRHSRPSPMKADATLLQFELPAGGVGVGIEDLLTQRSVYVPSRGLFVTIATNLAETPTLADHKASIAGRKTILEEVRALPDQTLSQAMARTHRAAQNEGPVMLSLSCDNTKFVVGRAGEVRFPAVPAEGQDWFAGAGELNVTLGDGGRDRTRRHLDGGWLPILVLTLDRDSVRCTERVFVAPADEDGADPARLNRPAVCVAEFTVENLGAEPKPVQLALDFRPPGGSARGVELQRVNETRFSASLGLLRGSVVLDGEAPLTTQAVSNKLTLTGTLPGHGRSHAVVLLGDPRVDRLEASDVTRLRSEVEAYWRAVLAQATQIETPEPWLNDIIRSSQVRCLIAARNEAEGARVAPWIAAMSYGPFESEAHSIVRGMGFLGHHDFARRGLEYFIHRYNTNGFLTTGYTTFGTAWHLWTLGEHVQLTDDRMWLRTHQAELRRVGGWILRQLEKTKHLGPDGRPVPEHGLMPPAVMADWNAYACHFMLNGYYHAALRELGAVLTNIEDPEAAAYTRGAEALRESILRAYRWTQAQAPALPLRDGTWIPLYPSQVHSPGKLEDFFPGADAGRSWAYDTELGAHQLVPTGVLAPHDPEVTRILNHLEDVQFLGEGWFDYPAVENAQDWFNLGGFAKVQPYYARNAEIYAARDDVKPFLRSYFNSLASLLNTEVLTLWEHFRHSGAWDKTHETGYFLHQTRLMLVQERGDDLWLAPLIPSAWLSEGKTIEVRNAPTRFGPVSYQIAARQGAGEMELQVTSPVRTTPRQIVVRLRHPEDRTMESVHVDGRPHLDFDPQQQIVTLKPARETARVAVRFH